MTDSAPHQQQPSLHAHFRNSNLQGINRIPSYLLLVQEITITNQQAVPTGEQKVVDFSRHVDECNIDFKENIMKKVEMIKLKDTAELQLRVDEIKHDEFRTAERLNKDYLVREEGEQHMIEKTKKKK